MSENNTTKNTSRGDRWKRIGRTASLIVDKFEVWVLLISTAGLAVLLIANVIARNVYRSIHFAEEIAKLFIILITFIGTSYAARKARHIRMGALLEALPVKVEKVLILIISAVSAAVMFYLAVIAFNYMVDLQSRGTLTPSLRAPYWLFIIPAPIGLFLAAFQFARTFIKNIVEKEVWLSPEQQDEYEDEEIMLENAMASIDLDKIELKETE
ncbi:MAG: TRAP transporter small permease [Sphaerochaetaceae bacterium]|nr:TRAP transporter small permease [Sphaerochaetaceae bacterium]